MNELVNLYYSLSVGNLPNEDEKILQTEKTIQYLIDCGFTNDELFLLFRKCTASEELAPDDLPDSLWEDSLIKRGVFYYHNTLRLMSPPPCYDIKSGKEISVPFFLEMRIRYTLDNLLAYYAKKTRSIFINDKRDKGALKALLGQYKDVGFIDELDFVLALIDAASYKHTKVFSVFDITKNEAETYDSLKRMTTEAKFAGKDVIVWR